MHFIDKTSHFSTPSCQHIECVLIVCVSTILERDNEAVKSYVGKMSKPEVQVFSL